MNKKSVIFTLISTVLLSIILLAFLISTASQSSTRIQRTNSEVETLNSFAKTANSTYIPRAIELSGIQATRSIIWCFIEPGVCGITFQTPNDQIKVVYDEIMYDGYIIGADEEIKLHPMFQEDFNYTLDNLLGEIGTLANLTGISFEYENWEIQDVYQDEPFSIKIKIKITYNISSKDQDTFFYYEDKFMTAKVPLYHFRDPTRLIYLDPPVNMTIIEAYHGSREWDETDLINDIGNATFVASSNAPSFFDKLRGTLDTPSENGITSFIDTNPAHFYFVSNNGNHYTNVDYRYFNSITGGSNVLQEHYPNFYLTNEYLEMYNMVAGVGGD